MGVQNLWKALLKDGAVEELVGSQAGQHAQIVEALENKVVAVDLSAWLMQAQSQPALLEHLDSPYARAVKVVFDRTIHWLRYGCLPVFVIEGRTPAAKLDKLRARCVAQYGPSGYSVNVGNREGGQFDRLGRAVKRLLDALGVPCVQAVGEAEAMCAALNVCGWVHAVHTADVDALLFGALTVYRQVELQTRDPRASKLVRCCMYDVRRVLGINGGGNAALMAVAHLAGGDYDMGGAENVGEALALGAVRQLLAGSEDDELVLQRLEAAVARGPDPELEALTKCTGCKACGHEGNRKNKIQAHSAKNGCAACGCEDGCKPREFTQCECAFHARADERLLNRVVRRAVATPNFMASFRTAAAAYAEQTRSAIASVQREYGLPMPGSSKNVFSWSCRPDVRAVSDIMCGYIKEWDYRQVRLKLLPLLLEWDVRQGPSPGPSLRAQVQFRPSSIRKVSSRGADTEDITGVPTRQQKGWRYVLLVDRLPGASRTAGAGTATAAAAAAAAAAAVDGVVGGAGKADGQVEAEDLVIDQSWIAGTARSRLPKQQDPAAAAAAAAGGMGGSQQQQAPGVDSAYLLGGDDMYEADTFFATQMPSQAGLGSPMAGRPLTSQQQQQSPLGPAARVVSSSQAGSQGGGSGGASGRGGGTLEFAEGRSVRCSLVDAVWPHLTAAFRQPAASGGRARSGGASRKKQPAAASGGAAGAAAADDKQRTVKDFFNVAKDYTAPGRQPTKLPASEGGPIPGLAGLAGGGGSSQGRMQVVAAAAAAGTAAAAGQQADRAAEHAGAAAVSEKEPQGFMEWLQLQDPGQVEQPQPQPPHSILQQAGPIEQQHRQQHEPQQMQQQQQQPQRKGLSGRRALSGGQTGKAGGSSGSGGAGSGSSRARKKQAAAKTPCKAGPLDRFLQRPAAAAAAAAAAAEGDAVEGDAAQHARQPLPDHQEQQQQFDLQMHDTVQQEEQRMQQSRAEAVADAADSPEIPSLAARLAAKAAAAAAGGLGRGLVGPGSQAAAHRPSPRSRQRPDSGHDELCDMEAAEAAGGGDGSSPSSLLVPPAKKASTPLAKELLGSPAKAAAGGSSSSSPDLVRQGIVGGGGAAAAGRYNAQYESLLQQMGVVSPEQQQQDQRQEQRQMGSRGGGRAVKGCLFEQKRNTRPSNLAQPPAQAEKEYIELLDSPMPPAAASVFAKGADVDFVDLT